MMKDKTRRNDLVCNDLARQYRVKANELETKHQQLNQLHTEFETKAQQKEVRLSSLVFSSNQIVLRLLGGRKSSQKGTW